MRPSRILKFYYCASFATGTALSALVAHYMMTNELGARGAALTTLCWNVLFVMLLPLVMDWAETRYFRARFVQLEEVAETNPELAQVISAQCEKLSIPGLRFAVIDSNLDPTADEMFTYGLWKSNPRVVISNSALNESDKIRSIPSIEAEITKFATQDHTMLFLMFTVIQVVMQQVLFAYRIL